MKKLLLLLTAVLTITSCNKDDNGNSKKDPYYKNQTFSIYRNGEKLADFKTTNYQYQGGDTGICTATLFNVKGHSEPKEFINARFTIDNNYFYLDTKSNPLESPNLMINIVYENSEYVVNYIALRLSRTETLTLNMGDWTIKRK